MENFEEMIAEWTIPVVNKDGQVVMVLKKHITRKHKVVNVKNITIDDQTPVNFVPPGCAKLPKTGQGNSRNKEILKCRVFTPRKVYDSIDAAVVDYSSYRNIIRHIMNISKYKMSFIIDEDEFKQWEDNGRPL